jgi:SAM-dependent methyltransferase
LRNAGQAFIISDMNSGNDKLVREYDTLYQQPHYFDHQASVERPFIKALARKAKLREGASVLDAGCGQGFFTWLFTDLGFKAVGVDISSQGILSAKKEFGSSGATFEVGDVGALPYVEAFDCVFARGLPLYNTVHFEINQHITDVFLRYVKPGGVFIFVHYTTLDPRRKSASWLSHSMRSVKKHFARYPTAKIYFSLRCGTSWLDSFAISAPVTFIDSLISRVTGRGGYALALVSKE